MGKMLDIRLVCNDSVCGRKKLSGTFVLLNTMEMAIIPLLYSALLQLVLNTH
jgi:hypothetical protein